MSAAKIPNSLVIGGVPSLLLPRKENKKEDQGREIAWERFVRGLANDFAVLSGSQVTMLEFHRHNFPER